MPLRIAARKIPDAVFLPVDQDAYNEASDRVMATLRSLAWGGVPVVVEVLGWDEAFLGPARGTATWATRGCSPSTSGPPSRRRRG